MRARPQKSGFTLIELALTLAVIGILSGMAASSFSGLTSARQNVAAARVRTALVYAQGWAMGSRNNTWVLFNVTNDTASSFVENPSNPGKANRLTMSDPLTRSAMVLQLGSSGVGITSAAFGGTQEVQFDPSGIPRNGNGTALAADGTVGVTGGRVIRVTKNTGLVTLD